MRDFKISVLPHIAAVFYFSCTSHAKFLQPPSECLLVAEGYFNKPFFPTDVQYGGKRTWQAFDNGRPVSQFLRYDKQASLWQVANSNTPHGAAAQAGFIWVGGSDPQSADVCPTTVPLLGRADPRGNSVFFTTATNQTSGLSCLPIPGKPAKKVEMRELTTVKSLTECINWFRPLYPDAKGFYREPYPPKKNYRVKRELIGAKCHLITKVLDDYDPESKASRTGTSAHCLYQNNILPGFGQSRKGKKPLGQKFSADQCFEAAKTIAGVNGYSYSRKTLECYAMMEMDSVDSKSYKYWVSGFIPNPKEYVPTTTPPPTTTSTAVSTEAETTTTAAPEPSERNESSSKSNSGMYTIIGAAAGIVILGTGASVGTWIALKKKNNADAEYFETADVNGEQDDFGEFDELYQDEHQVFVREGDEVDGGSDYE